VADYRENRRLIDFGPQEFNFDPLSHVEQALVYQAGLFRRPEDRALGRGRELLKQFKLYEKKDQDFRKLSGA